MFAIHLLYPRSVNFILINIHEIRFGVLLDDCLEKSPWTFLSRMAVRRKSMV